MTTPDTTVTMRRCIGSTKFGIEAHDAPPEDFPVQPSQKDGLGRMCKPHWNQYTTALRKASLARKAADGAEATGKEAPPESAVTTKLAKAKPARQAVAKHAELPDPPVSRPRRRRGSPPAGEPAIG